MKIASWNVNSLKVRLPQVLAWLDAVRPDVLGLQETKLTDEQFPVAAIAEAGYQVSYSGQKTYNGVALLTRDAADDVLTDLPGLEDEQRRVLAATVNGVRIYNLYVPNGQALASEKYAYKLRWLEHLESSLRQELAQHSDVIVMGDFNIAPTDVDVHDPDAWRDQIHCSEPERAALERLRSLGFSDTFRQFDQEPDSFSWWDYRAAAFRRNRGLRIDLILASAALAGRCTAAHIDTGPRRNERPSDHAPVVAEFT